MKFGWRIVCYDNNYITFSEAGEHKGMNQNKSIDAAHALSEATDGWSDKKEDIEPTDLSTTLKINNKYYLLTKITTECFPLNVKGIDGSIGAISDGPSQLTILGTEITRE